MVGGRRGEAGDTCSRAHLDSVGAVHPLHPAHGCPHSAPHGPSPALSYLGQPTPRSHPWPWLARTASQWVAAHHARQAEWVQGDLELETQFRIQGVYSRVPSSHLAWGWWDE